MNATKNHRMESLHAAALILLTVIVFVPQAIGAQTGSPGCSVPDSAASAADGGAVLVTGVTGGQVASGQACPPATTGSLSGRYVLDEGAGIRLGWFPRMAAFRMGEVTGDSWDEHNIGFASTAMGADTRASGVTSTALGSNTVASAITSTALGYYTTASRTNATAMGSQTHASGVASTAMGSNTAASGTTSTAMGGSTVASGDFSTAIGVRTTASGRFSTAMGRYASTDGHQGAFIYGDASTKEVVTSLRENMFTVRAAGGIDLYTTSAGAAGTAVMLRPGGGAWEMLVDRSLVENTRSLDAEQVLGKLAGLSVQSWNYASESPSVRHAGPMAGDFQAAFGLGSGETTINSLDLAGINMLAVQALEARTRDLNEVRGLLADTQQRLASLEAALAILLASADQKVGR